MDRLAELKKKYAELGEEIEKLEGKIGKPKEDEDYYTIEADGDIWESTWFDDDSECEDHYSMGNCFKTEEEAEVVVEKIKIYTELKRLAEEINTEPVDWGNVNQKKYAICCIHKAARQCDMKQEDWNVTQLANVVYSTNKDFFEIAKERIGVDRLLKLFKE